MFGLAASFNDSIVYLTDVQEIDSVWLEQKTDFLIMRDSYSNQLRNYLAEKKHEEHRTCIVSYALKRKDIDNKYLKTKSRYTKKGDFDVKYLTSTDFKFKKAEGFIPYESNNQTTKTKEKKEKKKKKKK